MATETRVVSDAALNDPSDYYFGKKEPRILELPTIQRHLSDTRGQWQAATMRWVESETDRIVRSRYSSSTQFALTNTVDVCRIIRESDWRDRQPARLMFVGHRLRSTPREDLTIEHEAGDILAYDVERAGAEIQHPTRKFAPRYTPGVPGRLLPTGGKPEPIIYGMVSDECSTETPPTMIAAPGYGGFMNGARPVFGFAPATGPTPPASISVTEVGGGAISTGMVAGDAFYFNLVGQDVDGNWGEPVYFALNSDLLHTVTGTNVKMRITWTVPPGSTAVLWRALIAQDAAIAITPAGIMRYGQTIDVDGAATMAEFDAFATISTGAEGCDVGNYYYAVAAVMADGLTTELNGSANWGFGIYQGWRRTVRVEVNPATVPATATHLRIWRLPGPSGTGGDVDWVPGQPTYGYWEVPVTQTDGAGYIYVDDDWDGTGILVGDPETPKGAHEITGFYGGKELMPGAVGGGQPGQWWHRWFVCGHACKYVGQLFVGGTTNYPNDTRIASGADFIVPNQGGYGVIESTPYRDWNGRRYTIVYGKGTDADELAAGTGRLAVNIQGIETTGDGSGALITDLYDQFKHWFVNFFLQDWQTGTWLDEPTWPAADVAWSRVDSDSWDTVRDAATTDYGSSLIGGGVINEFAPKREWLARWLMSTGTRIGINAGGQWTLVRYEPGATPITTYTEMRHVQAGSVDITPLHDEHWTEIPFKYQPRNDTWKERVIESAPAEDAYGDAKSGPDHALYFVTSAGVADYLMGLVRYRHQYLPWRVTFETIDLCGTNTDLGDIIALTHTAGFESAEGWESVALQVESHITMPGEGRVRIVGRLNQPTSPASSEGELARTLQSLTSEATATVSVSGSASPTLGTLTVTGTGTVV